MKFKIGDRVKITRFLNLEDVSGYENFLLGATGTIVEIDLDYKYPCELEFDDKKLQTFYCPLWAESELELIDDELTAEKTIQFNAVITNVEKLIEKIEDEGIHSWDDIISDLEVIKEKIISLKEKNNE